METWEQLYIAVEDELKLSEEAAREYAMSRRPYPVLKQQKTSKSRVATNPMRTKSHMLQRIKEAIIPLYFNAVGFSVPSIKKKAGKRRRGAAAAEEQASTFEKATAEALLFNGSFMQSDVGFPASVTMVVKLVDLLGASYRIIKPAGAGVTPYVDCTLGHFALVCAVIRGVFEKLVGIKAMRRSGLAGGIYQEYKNEVSIADAFLPKHNRAEKGMLLVDGHLPGRALLGDEEEAPPSGDTDELDEELEEEELEEEDISMDDLDFGETAEGMA